MAEQRRLTMQNGNDETVIDVEAEDISQLADDMDVQLRAITSEFDKDENEVTFEIKIYKQEKGGDAYLFSCTPEELPVLDKIRDTYQGGVYPVRVYKNGTLYRRFKYRIAQPNPLFNLSQNHKPTNEVSDLVKTLLEENRRQMSELQKILSESRQQVVQQPNMLEMMQGVAAMMATFQNMMPQPVKQTNDVEMLIQGITLARELGGGTSDAEANLYTTLNKTVETFGPVMAHALQKNARRPNPLAPNQLQRQQHQSQQQQSQQQQTTAPLKQLPNQQQVNNDMNLIQKKLLQQYGAMLIGKAAENADTLLYANLIIDNVDENMLQEYVIAETGIDALAAILPDINKYRPWFDQLRADVLEELQNMENDATIQGEEAKEPGNGDLDAAD